MDIVTKLPIGGLNLLSPDAGWWAYWNPADEDTISHVLGDVSAIDDQTGNGHHLSFSADLPVTGVRVIGGYNVLDVANTQSSIASPRLVQPSTTFLVLIKDIAGSARALYSPYGGVYLDVQTNAALTISGVGTGGVAAPAYGSAFVLTVSLDASHTRSFIQVNQTRNTPNAATGDFGGNVQIGSATGIDRLDGAFAFGGVFARAMSDAEISQYVVALQTRFGIA